MATPVGSIKLSRRLLTDDWWNTGAPRSKAEAWIDLLFLARWVKGTATSEGHTVALGRGEFLASERFLAERWRWSRGKVRTFLAQAQDLARISAQRDTQLGTVYRVVNYDLYQLTPGKKDQRQDQQEDQQETKDNVDNVDNEQPAAVPAVDPDLPVTPPAKPWTARAVDAARVAGYHWPGGRITAALKPHVQRDGEAWVVERVWPAYLRGRPYLDWDLRAEAGTAKGDPVKDVRFVSPQDFGNTYGFWDRRVTPSDLLPWKDAGKTGPVDPVAVELARRQAAESAA